MSLLQSTRRQALAALGSLAASSPLLRAQELIGEPPGRITPLAEIVNIFEFEPMAKRKLDGGTFSTIAGGDRTDLDRITFRPRMMVDSSHLDLATELLGQSMFAPILVGPASFQQKIHPEGELAMVRGASAAKAMVVLSSLSSHPLEKIAAEAKTPLWYQVFPGPDVNAVRASAQQAVKLGCKVICITVGTPYEIAAAAPLTDPSKLAALGNPALDWSVIDQLRQGLGAPVVLKGIMSPEEADVAVKRGIQGIVVSNYGGRFLHGLASPIAMLPSIADAVGGRIPVLIDGGFRRGTDVLKALILGAQAVLLTRPPLWGLAAYGAAGVQAVMEMAQSELARNAAMVGAPNLRALNRNMVRIHSR
jgi:4-hydroxymandelate oxidase